jgi:adenine-specific DNA-methyltransferase
MWFFIKSTGTGMRGGYFRFKTKYVREFPVRLAGKESPEKAEIIEKVGGLAKSLFGEKVSPSEKQKREREIDSLVFRLYDLSAAEVQTIEKSTEKDIIQVKEDASEKAA